MQIINLVGTEPISSAASSIAQSAERMERAVGSLEWTLSIHRQHMEEWLTRFEEALSTLRTKNE